MLELSAAVRARAEELVRLAGLPIESMRLEACGRWGLRVLVCNRLCGFIHTNTTDDGYRTLAEGEPHAGPDDD